MLKIIGIFMDWLSDKTLGILGLTVAFLGQVLAIWRWRRDSMAKKLEKEVSQREAFEARLNKNFRILSIYLTKNDKDGWANGFEYSSDGD